MMTLPQATTTLACVMSDIRAMAEYDAALGQGRQERLHHAALHIADAMRLIDDCLPRPESHGQRRSGGVSGAAHD
jgi:hypothetical protein